MAAEITDIRAYSTLGTDNLPRFLARNGSNQIFLDDGSQVGTLTGTSKGACFIPYRPNASPQSWMYTGSQGDYKKYSAPDASDVVLEYEVGIEEQQLPPEACPTQFQYTDYFGFAASWVAAGTASAIADTNRITDTCGDVLQDPASGALPDSKCSVGVTSLEGYQIGMPLDIDGRPAMVQALFPEINNGNPLSIESIFYFSGTTGPCVIVPTQSPVPQAFQSGGAAPSPYSDTQLSALTRGSLVELAGGAGTETVFVLSVSIGPDGTICFEADTTLGFVAADTITGIPAFSVSNIAPAQAGTAITLRDITYLQTGAGIGTISENLGATRPFNIPSADGTSITQQYDYVCFAINISDLERLVAVTFIFNINPSVTFDTDGYSVQLTASDLVAHPPVQTQVDALFAKFNAGLITLAQLTEQVNALSILPVAQYSTLLIPITSLKRFGGNAGLTLSDTNGIRVQVETTGTVNIRTGPFFVGIGDQPDIGPTGSGYDYLVRTRSSLTGAASNPSPPMRYAVTARRQSIVISMLDTNTDTQDDLWDIYRRGGSVNDFHYIGSTPNTGGTDQFTDNFYDTAARAGNIIERDNYQPWPTIDLPYNATAGVADGVTTAISIIGSVVIITYSAAAPFTDPAPAAILRWLPGTLIQIDGLNAYRLWCRPVAFTLATPPATDYFSYMFRLVENAGTATPNTLDIKEPVVANQDLAYLWGPDAEGTVFGCGDPLRPGTLYYCKPFTPDSAPDSYNQELCPPSEPLLGGEVINGLSYGSSTKRWWALYPSFDPSSSVRYQAVEKPVKRGLAAPYAKATDGKTIFFCAEDGIWTVEGQSLTDEDLYNIFPHEGVEGIDYVYGGKTVYAPDYKYASDFRLSYKNFFLYFDYRDSEDLPRTLVCDLRNPEVPAWSVDVYADPIRCHYGVEQQAGTLLDSSSTYPKILMGDDNGKVHVQADRVNDNLIPITAVVATAEFNGGDIRSDQLFNDEFLDLIPNALNGVSATIMEGGSAPQAAVVIPTSVSRVQTNIPVGLELKYMGVMLEWIDDFTQQDDPTLVRAWQPMYQGVPISVFIWKNQGTDFGILGYKHLRQVLFAYKATAEVTLTITVYDGTSPAVVVLPSTAGAYQKTMFPFSFNKGMLYFISASSTAEWQPYLEDCEFYVGGWDRGTEYSVIRDINAVQGIKS